MRWLPLIALLGCGKTYDPDAQDDEGFFTVMQGDTVELVPARMPEDVTPQPANNNLDATWHEGRLFLAFRSAPTHFASEDTVMWVVSSDDEGATWRREGRFTFGRDVREPQLVSTDDGLWLYMALLGTELTDFEPGGAVRSRMRGTDDWTEPEAFGPEGFIPWRIKPGGDGRWWMFGYVGGENVYETDGDPVQVHWYASDDGVDWEPAVGDDPVVLEGGGSETDARLREDGSLIAVVRNEAGTEADGFGSLLCTAPADDLGTWDCVADPRKYDSPLMLEGPRDSTWILGRRHLANDGRYDVADGGTLSERYFENQGAYWQAPKRCAIWKVEDDLTVVHRGDLPSRGDTCFPEAVEAPRTTGYGLWVFNYSNDPEGEDWTWIEGQVRPTGIYRTELDLAWGSLDE